MAETLVEEGPDCGIYASLRQAEDTEHTPVK